MASGGWQRAGLQHLGPVPHETLQRSGGGAVQPICPQAGVSGRYRPQSGVYRRNKAGKLGVMIYLFLAEKCGKVTDPSKWNNRTPGWPDHIRHSAFSAERGGQGDCGSQRQGQSQKPVPVVMGGKADSSGAVEMVQSMKGAAVIPKPTQTPPLCG